MHASNIGLRSPSEPTTESVESNPPRAAVWQHSSIICSTVLLNFAQSDFFTDNNRKCPVTLRRKSSGAIRLRYVCRDLRTSPYRAFLLVDEQTFQSRHLRPEPGTSLSAQEVPQGERKAGHLQCPDLHSLTMCSGFDRRLGRSLHG